MKKIQIPRIAGKVRPAQFENGLRVFVIPKYEAPTVTVQAWVATGSVHEGAHLGCGLSHFLEHMLFQGTRRLRNPCFPEEKFRSEKDVILRECAMYQDSPESMLYEKLVLEAYLVHPFRHPVIGYGEKIGTVTRDMMSAYHAARYTPGRTFYVIAGAVDPDRVMEQLHKRTTSWKTGDLSEPAFPTEPDIMTKRELTIRFNDPMTRTVCGWRIPPSPHPDLPAIEAFGDILGGSASSRLPRTLQNEKELALDIDSCLLSGPAGGISGIFANCLEGKRERLTEETFRILAELSEHGPTRQELERTIAQQTADCLRAMRTETGLAQIVGNAVLNGGSVDAADEYLNTMRNLTREDIVRVGELYFHPGRAALVHMLPRKNSAEGEKTKYRKPSLARPTMKSLKGGQRLIHLHDAALPLIDLFLMLPGGACYETQGIRGATKLIAATLCAGCAEYSEQELDEILDSHAIDLSVSAGTASLRIAVNCPKESLALTVKLLRAVLSAPLFPEKALERERTAILEELKVKQCSPDGLAEDLLTSTLFAGHPYGIPLAETIRNITAVKASDLNGVYRTLCLNAGHAVLGIAGDLTEKEAENAALEIIGSCEWNRRSLALPPPEYPEKAVRTERKLDKAQAVLFLGMPGPCALSDEVHALDILASASSSMSSQLFQTVRNRNGLAYYTGCLNMPGINAGCIAYYAGTNAESVSSLEELFLAEIRRVATEGLTKQEFADAKAQILFRLDSAMQSPARRLNAAVTGEFIGKGYLAELLKRRVIERLAQDQVNETIRKYLSAPGRVTALAIPGK